MRRKLKNLKNKGGHSENGAPRTLIELATYREASNRQNWFISSSPDRNFPPFWDPSYSGLSNPSRPRDLAVFLRPIHPAGGG